MTKPATPRQARSPFARTLPALAVAAVMAGCSLTLVKLDDELTKLWDAPVKTPGLRWGA